MKNAYKNKKKWGLIIIIAVMAIATLAMVAICINLGENAAGKSIRESHNLLQILR